MPRREGPPADFFDRNPGQEFMDALAGQRTAYFDMDKPLVETPTPQADKTGETAHADSSFGDEVDNFGS